MAEETKREPNGDASLVEKKKSGEGPIQLSWWGELTSENFDQVVVQNKLFKSQRIELFCLIKEILDRLEVPYWLDCGSLLGAHRHGGMLPHDNDFDLIVFGKDNHDKIREELKKLPSHFGFKDGTGYSKKYEIYNKAAGLGKPMGEVFRPEIFAPENMWMNVAGDVYQMNELPGDPNTLVTEYVGFDLENRRYKREWIFPLKTIEFEGMQVPCPRDHVSYLEEMYGYIGEDFRYNPQTCRYEKRAQSQIN